MAIGFQINESPPIDDDGVVFVAVSNDVEQSMPTLLWALHNLPNRVLCLIHVHQRSDTSPSPSPFFSRFTRRRIERVFDEYLQICAKAQVSADKIYIEKDDVKEGIVELVFQHDIKKLVMGASANTNSNGELTHLKSQKALYVCEKVPLHCLVWFICDGRLVHKRERNSNACVLALEETSPVTVVETGLLNLTPTFVDSGHLSPSSSEACGDLASLSLETTVEETFGHLTCQLERAALDAEKSKEEANKAAKTAMATIFKATEAYNKERKCRIEIEEALAKKDEDLQQLRKELDKDRLAATDQKSFLQKHIATCESIIKEMCDELSSTKEMADICKNDCECMKLQRDNAFKTVEENATKHAEEASSQINCFFSMFSVSDIYQATVGYHPSLKIKDGSYGSIYGSIYVGSLRKTAVIVKTLRQTGCQGTSHFQKKVDLLSKLRHPKLVTFLGACPETLALVYEYLPNGSLEDQLSKKENPLPWKTRISISLDLCAVLVFLHSSEPCLVHGNLKPGNILLDANFSCKLNDFGICREISTTDSRGIFPYMDPNFFETGELSSKTDIYSFGIILLQLLTGKSAHNVAADVQKALTKDSLRELLDPSAGDWPYLQARQLASLALRCCDETQGRRPDLDPDMWTALVDMRGSESSDSWDWKFHIRFNLL